MLQVENIFLAAGDFQVQDVCLRTESDEYFVIMGPTGSGKSLLAKCICGLVRATGGRIHIGGRDVTDLEPRLRRVGYVPQDCSLFPHMNVARNLTFARRVGGRSHRAAMRDLRPLIDMLRLNDLLGRRTTTLSGGERQKVALARALAAEPSLLVLDEPLSALDEPTRQAVSAELSRVQKELRIATIHICHNTQEAGALADRIGIMHQGRLVQVGRMEELRRHPANETVAGLLSVGDLPA